MIYFLVNNNYHMIDVYEHCEHLKEYEKSLIQIPHTLECIEKNENFKNIFTFKTPFGGIKNSLNILKVKKNEKNIKEQLFIDEKDILFVYTEYEILNQYIMSLFKKNGAKIYLIEDGGFPTYLTYGVKNEERLTFKENIKLFYLKYILGYSFVEFLKYNNILFPQINEKYIDGVLLYLDVKIVRNIKKFLIVKNKKSLNLDNSKAVFLNERMYDYYCSKLEQKTILNDILEKMTLSFDTIYFKFHPSETDENKIWQLDIIKKYKKVQLIDDNTPFENLIEKYQTKYVFSFASAALLNVNAMGAVPVYIYHLYDAISKNSVFKQIDLILKNANYTFVDKDYNFDKVGFVQKINCIENSTLKNFIRKGSNA